MKKNKIEEEIIETEKSLKLHLNALSNEDFLKAEAERYKLIINEIKENFEKEKKEIIKDFESTKILEQQKIKDELEDLRSNINYFY